MLGIIVLGIIYTLYIIYTLLHYIYYILQYILNYIHYILYYTQCILYIHYIYYIIYYTAKNVIGLRISRGRAHFGFSTWALNTSAYTRGGADSEVGGGHPNGGATSQRMPQPPEAGDTRNGICPRASGGGVVLPTAWFPAPALHSCERMNFFCALSHQVCDNLQ